MISDCFANCSDLKIIPWNYGPDLRHQALAIYFNTLTKSDPTNHFKNTLQNLVPHELGPTSDINVEDVISFFEQNGVTSPLLELIDNINQVVKGILDGKVVILFDGWQKAVAYYALDVDTNPARTAACPMTSAPTIDTADPIAFGIRTPASRRISKIISINNASRNAVNGVASSCETSDITNCVGIIS